MKTLGQLATEHNAEIKDYMVDDKIVSTATASNMYFSGDVILHISVERLDGGLNNSGTWPHYLVSDNGRMKIISA